MQTEAKIIQYINGQKASIETIKVNHTSIFNALDVAIQTIKTINPTVTVQRNAGNKSANLRGNGFTLFVEVQ